MICWALYPSRNREVGSQAIRYAPFHILSNNSTVASANPA